MELAQSEHLLSLQRNLQEAQAYKVSQGDHGWDAVVFDRDLVGRIIDSGRTYVAPVAGRIVASYELLPRDPEIWGEWLGNDGTALYLHRFAVSDGFRGNGVGRQCIAAACQKVIDTGRLHLRLHCKPPNYKLQRHYERNGFWCIGQSPLEDFPGLLYQRRV